MLIRVCNGEADSKKPEMMCVPIVVEKGLDVGFAFDGDADCCLCVDEKDNVIAGDHILYIYGCYYEGTRQDHEQYCGHTGHVQLRFV